MKAARPKRHAPVRVRHRVFSHTTCMNADDEAPSFMEAQCPCGETVRVGFTCETSPRDGTVQVVPHRIDIENHGLTCPYAIGEW